MTRGLLGERDRIIADVCVIGGGPAGSTVARQLAALGHDVCLVERQVETHPRLGATLHANAFPLLAHIGMLEHVEAAAFMRSERIHVWWAEAAPRTSASPSAPGLHVERARFDGLLLRHSATSGVRVLAPARALQPKRVTGGGWRVPICGPAEQRCEISARFLVDASGSRGFAFNRRRRLAPPLLALYARWKGEWTDLSDGRVEAGDEEWFWYAPLDGARSVVAVFLDPKCLALRARAAIDTAYMRRLRSFRMLPSERCFALDGPVTACDASSRCASDPVGPDFLAVGDSALTLDPLSSQGIQSAIASGIQGAIVINTLIRCPERAPLAIQFYRDRLAEKASEHTRKAASLYAERAVVCNRRFWRERGGSHAPGYSDTDSRVWPVHDLSPRCIVRVSHRVSIEDVPIIHDDLVISARAVRHSAVTRPVTFVDGIDVPALLSEIPEGTSAEAVAGAWSTRMPAARAWALMRWLLAHDVLAPSETSLDPPSARRPR